MALHGIIYGKAVDPSDRLKSIRTLPTEPLEFPADIVYARRKSEGILTLKTLVKETGGISPTDIIDIAVVSGYLQRATHS